MLLDKSLAQLLGQKVGPSRALVPNLFDTKDRFHGRQFFRRPGKGGWFQGDSNTLHLMCTLFLLLLLIYQLHLRSSGIRSQRLGGTPVLEGLAESYRLLPPSTSHFSRPAPSSFPPASCHCPSPSGGHFLMPFLNLAPVPPKSNQIHNLIRKKNEENVRLPASPLTGRRPAANLENVKMGVTTHWWEWGRLSRAARCWQQARPCGRATWFSLSKSGG